MKISFLSFSASMFAGAVFLSCSCDCKTGCFAKSAGAFEYVRSVVGLYDTNLAMASPSVTSNENLDRSSNEMSKSALDAKSREYCRQRQQTCPNGRLPVKHPNSFQQTNDPLYAKDEEFVYYLEPFSVIPNLSPVGLRIHNMSGWRIATDATVVVYEGKVVENADAKTFRIVHGTAARNRTYWIDKNHVFSFDAKLKRIVTIEKRDRASFRLSKMYSIDKSGVYFDEARIVDADVETFEGLDYANPVGKDKRGYYREDKFIGTSPSR